MVQLAYVIEWTQPGLGPSEKVDAGLLEKTDSMPRFTIMVKNSFLINSRLISNMTIVFSNSSSRQK